MANDQSHIPISESRARRAAKRVGLSVRKSRRMISLDNFEGFMLVDPHLNCVVRGERFDLTVEDVIAICDASAPQQGDAA